jgi:glycosyltransferase involved in cell wall biosynthesis
MRVTLVSPFDPMPSAAQDENAHWGGVEQVFLQVSRNLAKRGHEVTVLCSTDGESRTSTEEGVEVARVRRSGTLFRTPLVNLAGHLRDTDLVQVAATYPFTTAPVLRSARDWGIPSVLDFHFEPVPQSAMGRLAAAAYRTTAPSKYRVADAVLLRSMEYGENSPSLRRVPKSRWRVLPNGIDENRFRTNGDTLEGDYILFVGRLIPYKGVDVLLRALARHPVPIPLVVAGDGPLRASLQSQARRLGVEAHFLGHVSDERLPSLYRGARVSVLPSVNRQEAFGISLVESMACGTPVVASALPGVRRVAEHGGLSVPPGDVDALGTALREACVPGRLPRGPALSRKIHSRFSWQAVTRRLEGIYEQVLTESVDHEGGKTDPDPLRDPVL